MYTQCKLQYEGEGVGVAWIPTEFAKRNKPIIIGKKSSGLKAKVLEVWGTVNYDIAKERRTWGQLDLKREVEHVIAKVSS